MAPLDWFKFYPGVFFNDPIVLEMTDEEVGFYQRMLWRAWEQEQVGSLPTSIDTLARLLHRDRRKVQRMLDGLVGRCWFKKDDRIWNPRLVHEAEKQRVKSAKTKASVGERWRRERDTNVSTSKTSEESRRKKGSKEPLGSSKKDCMKWIELFNEITGTSYRGSVEHINHVKARIAKGFTLEQCRAVIESKMKEWKDDPKTAKWIRPETLFGTKFETYFQQSQNGLGESYLDKLMRERGLSDAAQ